MRYVYRKWDLLPVDEMMWLDDWMLEGREALLLYYKVRYFCWCELQLRHLCWQEFEPCLLIGQDMKAEPCTLIFQS